MAKSVKITLLTTIIQADLIMIVPELHRQKMERYRSAERRIGKYSTQKSLCAWELQRFNSAKATRIRSRLSSEAWQSAMESVTYNESDGNKNKEHNKRIRSNDSLEDTSIKKPKSDLLEQDSPTVDIESY